MIGISNEKIPFCSFKVAAMAAMALGSAGMLSACDNAAVSPAQNATVSTEPSAGAAGPADAAQVQAMVESWPEASRLAAADMMQKYGPPQEATASMLSWENNGPWKWTRIFREPVQHNFPMPHPDVLEQAIDYKVPVDRFDDLAQYDGSVIAERTKGQLSARCDKEGANFLAINLANDVATGKRTVADARTYYAQAMKTFMETKRMDPYMTEFRFSVPQGNVGDTDTAVL